MPKKSKRVLNALGEYLEKRSINKAEVCRKTGIHPTRMTWICYESINFLKAYELQLIALAIRVQPAEMQKDLFGDLQLAEENKDLSEREKRNIKIFERLGIEAQENLNLKEIDRIGSILIFCVKPRLEEDILKHLDLVRKSPNFNAILKLCVKLGWLDITQTTAHGSIPKEYLTTGAAKQLLGLN